MAEKIQFLEKILIGNILSLTKGLRIHLEREIICKIQSIEDIYFISHKGIKFMAFKTAAATVNSSVIQEFLRVFKLFATPWTIWTV